MPSPRTARTRTARTRTAVALTAAALTAVALTSCSDDDTPSSVASRAASAYASATAEAGRALDEIKGGVNAKSAVKAGGITTGSGGRAEAEITVENTTDATKSFAVQVDFKDEDGNLLDATVVTVSDVAAGATGKGTARSHRDLGGQVRAEVARAVRY
ncbi:FxLYD domain-containing protein [Streptomyces sp. KAU_LT]|uniref:FxLYD domain-containing protein n=1 Tax=Streptomyces sp. KAU_LT TaxID=3046669 RepID=UPI0024B81377|nr:FxLYD domain-containing protein [Streptomyces sp. KAU_LT]MDI9832251.1 FxLYD domain-containing protein [Streptomyces sp. KAU_LT]